MAGEWANPGASLGQGLNAGAAFGNSVVSANREREQHGLDVQARQAAAKDVSTSLGNPGDPAAQPTPQETQGHVGFLQSIGQALAHTGQGISNYFGGQQPPGAAPGAAPGGALPPQPVAPPPGGIPAPNPQAVPAPDPAPTANTQGGVAMMANGGPVMGYEAGGPVVNPAPGGIPSPGAGLANGLNAGAAFGQNVVGSMREREQHQLDQQDRASAAQYAQAATQPVQGTSGQAVPTDPQAAQSHVDHIENFATHLQNGALNDAGVPNGKVGIAPPNAPQQLAQAAQNPAAAKGIPEKGATTSTPDSTGSGPAHSLSPEYWDQSDKMLSDAVKAAALAGHDPDATYTALNHMRTSFVQGHMLRNLSAANVALQNGDMKGVEQGLHNMNYYLPNGQNLNIQKDDQGNLIYQNPLQPYVASDGTPTDMKTDKPNMIPVDAQHLQMLGQAVLDPMKVNDVLVNARSAAAKQQLERARAQAAIISAGGTAARGQAALTTANARNRLVPSQIYKNDAQAYYYSNRINAQIRAATDKPDPLAYKAGQDASKMVFDLAQGQPQTAPAAIPRVDKQGNPVVGPDGKPVMDPSMAPNAGKTFRDPSLVPSYLKGKTPDQLTQIASLSGELGAANHGRMPAARAVELASRLYTHNGSTHRDPATGNPTADVKFSKDRSQGWIWNGKAWENFNLSKKTGGALSGGNVDTVELYSADSDDTDEDEAGAGLVRNSPDEVADDNAPAQ